MTGNTRRQGMDVGLGAALGLLIGVALSVSLNNWAYLGIGLALDPILGAEYLHLDSRFNLRHSYIAS